MAEATPAVQTTTSTPPPAASPTATLPPPTPAAEKPPAPAPQDDRLAQLVAKERALVKQQQELKAEREAIAKEKAEAAELKALLQNAKRDPETIAKKLWGDSYYDEFTRMRLEGTKVTPELIGQSLDERLAAFEKRQKEEKEAQAAAERERLQQEQSRIIETWRTDIRDFVTARGEEYELINMHGWQDQVVRVIEEHFRKSGKILSTKEGADLVEQQLQEAIQKSLNAKKFAKPSQEAPEKPIGSAQPRTLTNALTPASSPAAEPPLTEEERILRAIAKGREVAQRQRGA